MSAIEWTDATWNPVLGCSMARGSETGGCLNCYAARMAMRNLWPGEAYARMTQSGPRWTGNVELRPERLDAPLRWRKPRRVFVNSMSDLFHEAWLGWDRPGVFRGPGFGQLCDVANVMRYCRKHTFQILTKRPHVMADMWPRVLLKLNIGGPLPNVWLGVSVEDQATADERIPLLLQTPAAVRFVSYEPALGPANFTNLRHGGGWLSALGPRGGRNTAYDLPLLDWVIVGGESGPHARPFDLAWARSVVGQCREVGVACFVKQLGARPVEYHCASGKDCTHPDCGNQLRKLKNAKGGDPSEWSPDLRVREFPR